MSAGGTAGAYEKSGAARGKHNREVPRMARTELSAYLPYMERKEKDYGMVFLVIAGGLEVFWSTCMKYSNGFTELKFTILTVVGMIFSFLFLSQATKTLPLGTANAVWTGIGALGAVIVGIVLFKER